MDVDVDVDVDVDIATDLYRSNYQVIRLLVA